jgi:hypothetical protein
MLCSVLFLSLTSDPALQKTGRHLSPREHDFRAWWVGFYVVVHCDWYGVVKPQDSCFFSANEKANPVQFQPTAAVFCSGRRKQWVRWDLWTVYNAWCMHAWIEFVALSDEGYRKHTQQRRHPHPKSLLRCSDVLLYACAWWQLASWTENGVLNCHLSNYSLHIYKISVLYNISVNYCEYKSWIAF